MVLGRLPGNQEDRAAYLREHDAALFIDLITEARRDSIDDVITTVAAFADDPEALYVALEYASHSGVAVSVAPIEAKAPLRSSQKLK
jgi:sugar/nucleoside kinase (ribokinase family)